MKSFKTQGIIINRRNFGEADRIITIFTKTHGKLKVKAKGVRRIASRRSPHVELLNYGDFSLYQGPSMPILTEASPINNFDPVKKDLKRIGSAFHICELIDGLCAENQENPEIFNLLYLTLEKLSTAPKLSTVIIEFEVELLRLLGFHKSSEKPTKEVIEEILERKLKTRPMLYLFAS